MKVRSRILPMLLVGTMMLFAGCSSTSSTQRKETTPIRVMTYNIRFNNPADGINAWPNRKDHVAEMIGPKYLADLAGVQEALKGQLDDLQQRLPQYAWFGVARDDGKEKGEYSAIFYRKDRFQLLGGDTFWLSVTPTVPGSKSWDSSLPRIVTWVRLKDRQSGREFHYFNTHFDHRGDTARAESARLIARRAVEIAGDTPFLITGDLNTTEKDPPYAHLTTSPNILDARYASETPHQGPTKSFSNWQELTGSDNGRIDYIFVRRGVRVLDHRILDDKYDGRFPSDHVPVLATVALP